jgi:acid stress-induced BolA-like protein IbaG/YrbA
MGSTPLNDNEIKIGTALIEVFTNYDEIFIHGEGNKFNKNLVLLNLREMTNLSTKEIRNSLKKYKIIYKDLSQEYQD